MMKTPGQTLIQRLYTEALWVVMHPYRRPSYAELNIFPGEGQRHQSMLHHIRYTLDSAADVVVVHDTHITGEHWPQPAEEFADYPRAYSRRELVDHIQSTGKTELVYTGFHWGWCLHNDACGIVPMSEHYRCYALRHCCAYTAEDASTLKNVRRINQHVEEKLAGGYSEI